MSDTHDSTQTPGSSRLSRLTRRLHIHQPLVWCLLSLEKLRSFSLQRAISFYFNKDKTNFRELNLAIFRVHANYSFTKVPNWSKKEQEFSNDSFPSSSIRSKLCDDQDLVIFISVDALEKFRRMLEIIFPDFEGTFVIDPRDGGLWEKPDWIGPNARWAAPHIPNPFDSSGLCLPIGVQELSLNRNGRAAYLTFQPVKNKLVLVGPFGPTHQARSVFSGWFGTSTIDVMHRRLRPNAYARLASDYKFVVCPRGNGIDTHRFWETLYRGSIPIVESSNWAKYFQSHGVPMVVVSDFEELLSWNESDFHAIWLQHTKTPSEIESLWPEYWLKRVQSNWPNLSSGVEFEDYLKENQQEKNS